MPPFNCGILILRLFYLTKLNGALILEGIPMLTTMTATNARVHFFEKMELLSMFTKPEHIKAIKVENGVLMPR